MISIVITSFNEPLTIAKAIDSFLNQKIREKYELFVCAPDEATLNIARSYQKKNKQIKLFKDPGKGKSFALNLLLPNLKGEIIILTDGDVYVSDNSVNAILDKFQDEKVGCVSGRVASQDSRDSLFGYWGHILFQAAHDLRKNRYEKKEFLECSGYLWAFRNILKSFPEKASEDAVVPIIFYNKGYKIAYAESALVYVKSPASLHDFIEQKKRNMKGHEILERHFKADIPRMKTLSTEIVNGYKLLLFPRNLKEIFFTLSLFPLRLYIWMLTFYHLKLKKQEYSDGWKRIDSTK
jgi:cellulose synthase/poly-beta-1,6-N-acetylglucosamine synthase-like glycosyltransferase